MPLAITATFCTALVPAISSAISVKDMKTVNKRLSFSLFASILIIMPCAAGLAVLADPILKMIYPAASEGAWILAASTLIMVFVSLNYVVNGGLYGFGKTHIPAISLAIGGVTKLVLNVILISNPKINIYGAVVSSIICQGLAFFVCLYALNKQIKLDLSLKRHLFKPIFASVIMGAVVYFMYNTAINITSNTISTIISIFMGVIIYVILVLGMKMLNKEEIYMIPFGTRIYSALVKMKIYKEKK